MVKVPLTSFAAPSSLLKKSLPELFQHAKQKARFLLCFIFKHLPCLKMPAHPCAGSSLLKNGVFQQTASRTCSGTRAATRFPSRDPMWKLAEGGTRSTGRFMSRHNP
jgi:hypothetical protein